MAEDAVDRTTLDFLAGGKSSPVLQGIWHHSLEQDSLDNLACSCLQLEEQMQMI